MIIHLFLNIACTKQRRSRLQTKCFYETSSGRTVPNGVTGYRDRGVRLAELKEVIPVMCISQVVNGKNRENR